MYRDGQLRDISEVSEVGVTIIQQFRHLGPFTHPLSSSPSVDHAAIIADCLLVLKTAILTWRFNSHYFQHKNFPIKHQAFS